MMKIVIFSTGLRTAHAHHTHTHAMMMMRLKYLFLLTIYSAFVVQWPRYSKMERMEPRVDYTEM